jgi:radical SAM superfamily enzyme YgiQ (UPF0313 family)
MVINGVWKNQALSLSLKPNSLTFSLQSHGQSQVFSFDGEGRLWTAMLEGISYRRGLNGKTVAKWQLPGGQRERRWLAAGEAIQVQERARQTTASLLEDLRSSAAALKLQTDLPENSLDSFERVVAFTNERYQADIEQYHHTYQPVGILPPDQYMAVVLQATEGCSFNTCTFCNFYRDRRFRIKTAEQFEAHAQAVKDFLGLGLSLRRTLFLGDANALVVPMPRLLTMLDIAHAIYDVERLGGIYAFLDGFSGEKKTSADYAHLAQRGVKRIYIGMESGNAGLLQVLKKPGNPEDVVQAVRAIKAGGIAVGIIILLGAGGQAYAQAHVRDTIQALNAMPLGLDDLIYFSELIEDEGLEYTQAAYQQQLHPLNAAERIAQGEAIERGLNFSARRGIPHISRYDIREFVY